MIKSAMINTIGERTHELSDRAPRARLNGSPGVATSQLNKIRPIDAYWRSARYHVRKVGLYGRGHMVSAIAVVPMDAANII